MEWYTKAGGSSNDYFFIKDQSDDPYYSGTQRYNLAGETVSKWLGDDGQFTHYQNGDEDGSISDWYSPDPPNVTTTAINLSLVRALYSNSGDIGGNCNNYAPDRSGNSGQPSLMTNTQYGVNGITSTVLLGKSFLTHQLAKDFVAGGDVAEITEAAAQLNEVSKPFKIIGKVLGVLSVAQHTSKFIDAYENGNVDSAILNGGKIALDVLFMTSKCVNPVFLGASVAYGVVDYMTDDY
jgi:hypothetical protein